MSDPAPRFYGPYVGPYRGEDGGDVWFGPFTEERAALTRDYLMSMADAMRGAVNASAFVLWDGRSWRFVHPSPGEDWRVVCTMRGTYVHPMAGRISVEELGRAREEWWRLMQEQARRFSRALRYRGIDLALAEANRIETE